jgi:hypothetical protein
MEHGLVGIMLTDRPGRPNVACGCGRVASGAVGATWTVTDNGDGTASCSPSFDWKGHFHETAVRVPIMDGLPENFRDGTD